MKRSSTRRRLWRWLMSLTLALPLLGLGGLGAVPNAALAEGSNAIQNLAGCSTNSLPANDDGSTTIAFGPARPEGSPAGNWIQTTEGKGWFPILRLYSPREPFFDRSWRPSEIETLA